MANTKQLFWARKVTATFEKQAPELSTWTNITLKQNAHPFCDPLP